jgi:hypothetical protein
MTREWANRVTYMWFPSLWTRPDFTGTSLKLYWHHSVKWSRIVASPRISIFIKSTHDFSRENRRLKCMDD